MDDCYADAHRDRIYEALESEIKEKAPTFYGLLDEIEAWTWIGEVYCIFPKSKSLFTDRMRSDQPFAAVVRNFGYRHGIRIQLRTAMPLGCGGGTDFRQLIKASHHMPNHRSGDEYAGWEHVNTVLPHWNQIALIKRLSHKRSHSISE
jgi:hypothetical protein